MLKCMFHFRTLVRLNIPKASITLDCTPLILTLKVFRHHLLMFRSGRCVRGHLFQPSYFMEGNTRPLEEKGAYSRPCDLETRLRIQVF